jgi:hypothetical protein
MERGLVFTTPKGTPLVPSNLDGRLRPLLEDAGLPRMVGLLRILAALSGHFRAGGDGATRPLSDLVDDGHLLSRDAGNARRRRQSA